jgi:hypothetical protein
MEEVIQPRTKRRIAMRTSNLCKVVCGVSAAALAMAWCASASAQPHHHPHSVVVVRPYPVIRPYPIVSPIVRPAPPVVVYRQPVVVSSPLPDNPAPLPVVVTIENPASNGATLSFRVQGATYQLTAGASQTLELSGPRTIEFNRGGGFGIGRLILRDGLCYVFTSTERGWALHPQL